MHVSPLSRQACLGDELREKKPTVTALDFFRGSLNTQDGHENVDTPDVMIQWIETRCNKHLFRVDSVA